MHYKGVKFHKNPISGLGGVALTRYMDRRTDGRTDGRMDRVIPIYPQNFAYGGDSKTQMLLKYFFGARGFKFLEKRRENVQIFQTLR